MRFSFDMKTCLTVDMKWIRECNAYADNTQWAQEECDGQHSCEFYGKPQYAGDPCVNIMKFTVINYECVPGSNFTF